MDKRYSRRRSCGIVLLRAVPDGVIDMMWTDDPVRDWDRYCEAQEREAEKYPACQKCGATLYSDVYTIDNKVLCDDCTFDLYAEDADVYDRLMYCEHCGKPLTGFVHNIDGEVLCKECVYKNYGEKIKKEEL